VPSVSIRYNFGMAWAIITVYTSKCAQMDPKKLLKTSEFHSRCKKCYIEKILGGGYNSPLGSPKVNTLIDRSANQQSPNYLLLYLSIYLSVCLLVCLSVSLPIRISIHPSIHPCIYSFTIISVFCVERKIPEAPLKSSGTQKMFQNAPNREK